MKCKLHERLFYDILAPGIFGEMDLHPAKLEEMARSAVILRIFIAKPPIAAGTNSLSTTNEKRTTQCPTKFSETRTVQARTQSTQSIRRSGDERPAPEYSYLYCPKPAAAVMPRRSGFPGLRRWSPEDGGEGLRRVHLLRPLVRRKATIKSTRAMRYSSLKKAIQTTTAKRSFLIIKQRKSADCKS